MRKSMVMALLVCAAFATQLLAVGEARLTGKVVDPAGKPLEGVKVTATATEEITWEQSVKTKKDGTFAFFIIRGTVPYNFKFEKDGYGTYEEVIKLKLVPEKNDRTFTLGGTQVVPTEAAPASADPATIAYNEGVAHWNKGEEAAAIAKIEEAVALNADLTAGHIALAKMYGKTKNWDKAIAAGNKALEIDSDQPEINAIMAEAYASKGDKAKAAEYRKKAPANAPALFNEAARLINSGNDAEAEGLLKQAIAADAKFAKAHYELGMVYARLGRNPEAKTHLEAYLQLEPNGSEAATAKEMLSYVK